MADEIECHERRALGPRVLVIANDDPMRSSLGFALNRSGFHALEASTGSHGLALATSTLVEAVLLDVNVPDLYGFAIIEAIRTRGLPVIVVALRIATSRLDAALDAGANDFVMEPFRELEIATRIHLALERCAAVRERPVRSDAGSSPRR